MYELRVRLSHSTSDPSAHESESRDVLNCKCVGLNKLWPIIYDKAVMIHISMIECNNNFLHLKIIDIFKWDTFRFGIY